MASQILKIRNRIIELLKIQSDFLEVSVSKIYANRIRKIDNTLLPAIAVYMRSDKVEDLTVNAHIREYKRTAPITIDLILRASDGVDTRAFELLDRVERVLLKEDLDGNSFVDPVWADLRYVSSELNLDNSGDIEYGVLTISLDATYYKEVDYDELPDLTGITTTYKLQVKQTGEFGEAEATDIKNYF